MDKSIEKYSGIELSPAENGFILRYCECREAEKRNTFDDEMYDRSYKELVYEDKDADKAFDKFKELHMYNKKNGTKKEDSIIVSVKSKDY